MVALDALFDLAEARAREHLKRYGEAGSGIVFKTPEGTMSLLLNWSDEHQKAVMLAGLKAMFADIGVTAYALWSEAWVGVHTIKGPVPDDPTVLPPGIPLPSDDPNSIDVLVVVAVQKGEPAVMRQWRLEKGKLTRMDDAGNIVRGRLAELLEGD